MSGDTATSVQKNSTTPMTTPTTISRQDSGKIRCNFGVIWKPGRGKEGEGLEYFRKIMGGVLRISNCP